MVSKLAKLRNVKTRSISAENPQGLPSFGGSLKEGEGARFGAHLGEGFKVSPCVFIPAHGKHVVADIKGSGAINHIWMTCDINHIEKMNIKIYWDNCLTPSVDTPLGHFFCMAFNKKSIVNSLMVTVNPSGGMNSWWVMPFKKAARIIVTNENDFPAVLYYQVDYELRRKSVKEGYFHAIYSKSEPVEYKKNHILLPKINAKGQYVGTFMTFETDFITWWGEGEIKFFLDGDDKYSTICGTGTEDYFGGAWNFEQPKGKYHPFNTAYQGLVDVLPEDEIYIKNQKFSMYRWHINDPIVFKKDVRVEIQCLGWEEGNTVYKALQPNVSSISFLYLTKPYGGR